MKPDQLTADSFALYGPAARAFAVEHLPLLKRLPLAVCPSFLQQIQSFDTLFPAERETLRWQCDQLGSIAPGTFAALTAPLQALTLSNDLEKHDWVRDPARFVTDLTGYLWSSSQLDAFRKATLHLFAAIPPRQDSSPRLAVVVLGQGAQVQPAMLLRKLRRQGVYLTALQHESAFAEIGSLAASHAQTAANPYAAWYVDGGTPHPVLTQAMARGTSISYPQLDVVRQRALERMLQTVQSGAGGAEQMRTHLTATSVEQSGVHSITRDPILARFYTELFTESSGPQIFSTSFTQWAGRELARRAQPTTLLLRYAPRQRHQDMNAMFTEKGPPALDPQGSLLDADIGTFYNWIEMNRITAPGKLTFIAWAENQPFAVVIGPAAPAGAVTSTPMTLAQALKDFS